VTRTTGLDHSDAKLDPCYKGSEKPWSNESVVWSKYYWLAGVAVPKCARDDRQEIIISYEQNHSIA
jgi:hypothetical protein